MQKARKERGATSCEVREYACNVTREQRGNKTRCSANAEPTTKRDLFARKGGGTPDPELEPFLPENFGFRNLRARRTVAKTEISGKNLFANIRWITQHRENRNYRPKKPPENLFAPIFGFRSLRNGLRIRVRVSVSERNGLTCE